MDRDTFKGKWNEIKGRVRAKYGELTDDDVAQVEGNYDQLVGAIQQRYGRGKEEVERELDNFLGGFGEPEEERI